MVRNLYLFQGRPLRWAINWLTTWTPRQMRETCRIMDFPASRFRPVRVTVCQRRRKGRVIVRNLFMLTEDPLARVIDEFHTYTRARAQGTRIPLDQFQAIQVTVEARKRRG